MAVTSLEVKSAPNQQLIDAQPKKAGQMLINETDGTTTLDVSDQTRVPLSPGPKGGDGKDGADGTAATVAVGTTTTLPAGSQARVTNTGTENAAVFNFSIPVGGTGPAGKDGTAATVAVGTTTTLPAGSQATVTNTGTAAAAVFNFGIPAGADGAGGQSSGLTSAQRALVTAAASRHALRLGPNVLSLGLVSDTHACDGYTGEAANATGRSMARTLVNYAELALAAQSATLDGIVLLGDNQDGGQTDGGRVRWTPAQAAENWVRMAGSLTGSGVPVFPARGNHDDNTDGNRRLDHFSSPQSIYRTFNRVFDQTNGATHDSENPESLYYYKDFDAHHIRMIVLDFIDYPVMSTDGINLKYWGDTNTNAATTSGWGFGARQVTWLATEALDFSDKEDPTEWATLVFSHAGEHCGVCDNHKNGQIVMKILDAFNKKEAYAYENTMADWAVSGTVNFATDTTAGIIGFIQGHEHKDFTVAPGDVSSTISWRKNPYSFQISGVGAGFRHKDGYCLLLAVDRGEGRIYVTAICASEAISAPDYAGDRVIPIPDPLEPDFIPKLTLAQGTVTIGGIQVTVVGNRVTLNGDLTLYDRAVLLSGSALATATLVSGQMPEAWAATPIAEVPTGTMHRCEMHNVTGSCKSPANWGLARMYFGDRKHNSAASAKHDNLIPADAPTTAANICAVVLGIGGSPVSNFGYTNYSFDLRVFIDGERYV